MGTSSIIRRSRHELFRKVAVGSEALYGGRGESKDILDVEWVVVLMWGRGGGRVRSAFVEGMPMLWRGIVDLAFLLSLVLHLLFNSKRNALQ